MSSFFDNAGFALLMMAIIVNLINWLNKKKGEPQKPVEYGDEPYEWEDLLSEEGEAKRTIRDSLYTDGERRESVLPQVDMTHLRVLEQAVERAEPIHRTVRMESREPKASRQVKAPRRKPSNLTRKAREGLVWGIVLGPCKSKELMMERRMK